MELDSGKKLPLTEAVTLRSCSVVDATPSPFSLLVIDEFTSLFLMKLVMLLNL